MLIQHARVHNLARQAAKLTPPNPRVSFANPRQIHLDLPFSSPFSPNSGDSSQILKAQRVLGISPSVLYGIISDIESYPHFLPFCTGARILSYSSPDRHSGRRHPASASLSVGWKGISEDFVSNIYCKPNEFVEAISGSDAKPYLPYEVRKRLGYEDQSDRGPENDIFKSLSTKWNLKDINNGQETKVDLEIQIKWKNALYFAMSQTAVPKVGDVMIEAFEKRVREVSH